MLNKTGALIVICLLQAPVILFGQEKRFAVTAFSVNFLREKPDFPEELGTQALMGTPVEITGEEGYWRQVVTPEPYRAWCTDLGLAEMTEDGIREYIAAPKYIVTSEYSHVFSGPDTDSERISDLVAGDLLRIKGRSRTAGKIKGTVRKGFAEVTLPSGENGFVPEKDVEEFEGWASAARATEESIISTANRFLGIPYMWGGTSFKGVDCSGLTRMVWFMNGVLLPRNASQQARTGTGIEIIPCGKDAGREEMLSITGNLQAGDLIFFGDAPKVSHVGIYIGDGRFIHASQKVRINSLIPGEPDWYEHSWKLHTARRVIGQEDCGKGITSIRKSPAYFPEERF